MHMVAHWRSTHIVLQTRRPRPMRWALKFMVAWYSLSCLLWVSLRTSVGRHPIQLRALTPPTPYPYTQHDSVPS